MSDIYWVGPRQSDVKNLSFFFKGTVTVYGNNQNGNISYCHNNTDRINHNIYNETCNHFFMSTLERICAENSNAQFLFYNPLAAYDYSDDIVRRTIGLNEKGLLETLSDKIMCRYLLCDYINTTPFVTLRGSDCTFENISKYFKNVNAYVIQKIHSSGGNGTYYVDSQESITCIDNFRENHDYLVSPYINDSISLNTHIIVYKDSIQYLPSSVQIINRINGKLLYQGADFVCYESLSKQIKDKVYDCTKKVGEFLQKKGYLGVLGIDYLLTDNELYFMEFNPRFQASSELINKVLIPQYHTSIQELHLQAFCPMVGRKNMLGQFQVHYSNFAYSTSNTTKEHLNILYSSDEVWEIQTDGYDYRLAFPSQEDVHLIRCIFNQNISSIFFNKLRLHPNIYSPNMAALLDKKFPHYKEYTKIALLNQGASITPRAKNLLKNMGTVKEAVFDAIDVTIFHTLSVNVPVKCRFSSLSPFVIDVLHDKLFLFMEEMAISEIVVDMMPDNLLNKRTKNGVPYDAIIQFATDRIRINPASICIYKVLNQPCKFCNLPYKNYSYTLDDIKETIDFCLENVVFRHFLIGGGTYSLDGNWDIVVEITKYIRSKSDKDIYLMVVPPKDNKILATLKKAGITEVAFDLEIFDRKLAQEIMPGKGTIKIQQYMEAFKQATVLWGSSGNVRSLLIFGFDSNNIFLEGIEQLCKLGVEPIISIFRPLQDTELSNKIQPSTVEIIKIYQHCLSIVQKYSLILGPDCPKCQNNTLSYTE